MILGVKWKIKILIIFSLLYLPSLLTAKSRRVRKNPCKRLKTIVSEEEHCYIKGQPLICPKSNPPGTVFRRHCQFPYNSNGKNTTSYACQSDGYWVPRYDSCQPDCGRITSNNEFPWIAAIYDPDEELICPGAIISPYHVVMGGQCLPVDTGPNKKMDYYNYTIIAGKHYSNIHRQRNSQQTRGIKLTVRSSGYKTWSVFKKDDMILVEVDREFEFFDDVRPACMDWQSLYEEWDYKDINEGIAVEWIYDKEEVIPCSWRVQYWKGNICQGNLNRHNKANYMESDNSCAVYTDDNSTCARDIGMGIFFKPVQDRYFLKGIASTFDLEWENHVIYTKISSYYEWLKSNMKKNKRIYPIFETTGRLEYASAGYCILPEHPQYGIFSLGIGPTYPAGTKVPSNTFIHLSCNGKKKSSFRCSKNEWNPRIKKNVCKQPGSCPSLQSSKSEQVYCKLNGQQASCEQPSANTTAVIVCQEFYALTGQKPIYKCQDGKWDPPYRSCSLECGTKRMGDTGFPMKITETARNEYPWIVAIYKDYIHICGGTLISRRHILSGAHCFGNSTKRFRRIHEYWFMAGKHFSDFNINEKGFQTRSQGTLYIYRDYDELSQGYRFDIALIELDEEFIISLKVQPVCIDWESIYEDIDFTTSRMGVVAGWGFTDERESVSHVLKNLAVPFQPKEVCLELSPDDLRYKYGTVDKVCIGYSDNSTNVCNNDGGAGLYYKSDGKHYFLRGIASLGMKTAVGCDSNHYTLYTKVSRYLSWIGTMTRKIL